MSTCQYGIYISYVYTQLNTSIISTIVIHQIILTVNTLYTCIYIYIYIYICKYRNPIYAPGQPYSFTSIEVVPTLNIDRRNDRGGGVNQGVLKKGTFNYAPFPKCTCQRPAAVWTKESRGSISRPLMASVRGHLLLHLSLSCYAGCTGCLQCVLHSTKPQVVSSAFT